MIRDRHVKHFHVHVILPPRTLENSDLRAEDELLRGEMKTRVQEGRPVSPGDLWRTWVASGPLGTETGNAGLAQRGRGRGQGSDGACPSLLPGALAERPPHSREEGGAEQREDPRGPQRRRVEELPSALQKQRTQTFSFVLASGSPGGPWTEG